MEYADFAVKLEEILAKDFTSYECTATNADDVGLKWNFVYQGVVCGYAGIEENSDTYKAPTFNIGLVLHEINLFQRDKLVELFKNNLKLLYGTLGVIEVPIVAERDDDELSENLENSGEESVEMTEFLVLQINLVYAHFDVKDFLWYVRHLMGDVNTLFTLCKDVLDTTANFYVYTGEPGGLYTEAQKVNATKIIYLLKQVERKFRRRLGSKMPENKEQIDIQEYVVRVKVRPSANQNKTEKDQKAHKKTKTSKTKEQKVMAKPNKSGSSAGKAAAGADAASTPKAGKTAIRKPATGKFAASKAGKSEAEEPKTGKSKAGRSEAEEPKNSKAKAGRSEAEEQKTGKSKAGSAKKAETKKDEAEKAPKSAENTKNTKNTKAASSAKGKGSKK